MGALTEGQPQEGQRVTGTVTEVRALGLVVQLTDGQRVFIRNRELYWTRASAGPSRVIQIGDHVEAVAIRPDPESAHTELSIRRAQGDPWEQVRTGKYRQGSVVSGEVVNLQSFGAFVEIEPGIDGLLYKEQIPGGEDQDIHDLLWIGDHIRAVISRIQIQDKHIRLSIRELLQQRRSTKRPTSVVYSAGSTTARRNPSQRDKVPAASRRLLGQRLRRIMVVDNDQPLADGLVEWLQRLGYDAVPAYTGGDALAESDPYDLVFLDIDLDDMSGILVAEEILTRCPQTKVVLMTGLDWIDSLPGVSPGLGLSGLLLKPLDYNEALTLLYAAEAGALPTLEIPSEERDETFLAQVMAPQTPREDIEVVPGEVLERIRQEADAEVAVVFEVGLHTHRTSILAASGLRGAGPGKRELDALWFSPVRDVAVDGETIQESSAPDSARFDTLLKALYFESVVAVPVPPTGDDVRHALFLFDPSPDRPLVEHLRQASAGAYLVAAAASKEQARVILEKSQRFLLTGQLATSMLHEVRNKISDIEQQARLLELDCEDLAEDSRSVPVSSLSKTVQAVLEANAELRGLSLEYLGLMGKDRVERVDINELLEKTVRQVRPLARANDVDVTFDPDLRIPSTMAVSLRLRQVFLNVALNAVQQMGTQPLPEGCLEIASRYDPRDQAYPIQVTFADWGPGIHRGRWDWVFSMGTSTREEGAGLGLFVSKGLLKSMGSRIAVQQSYMHVGSTFVVELPIVPAGEVDHE